MKKGLLLILGLLAFIHVQANEVKTNNRYTNTVRFVEEGVAFRVFLNGEFDFDSTRNNPDFTRSYNNQYHTNYRSIRVERDHRGRIRRIGRVAIRYNRYGNVYRIGHVKIRYRRGFVNRVGNLSISYNRSGSPYFHGQVHNGYHGYNHGFFNSFNFTFGNSCAYDDPYFYRDEFRHNYRSYKEDANFYYYKAIPNAKIGKRNKVLKRRKKKMKTQKRTQRETVKKKRKRRS